MTLRHARVCTTVSFIALLALHSPPAWAQDSIAEARKLYQSADYDAALGMLDRLTTGGTASAADPEIAPYRVLCLLALGKSDEAQQSIAAIFRQDPRYRPSETEISPRIRAVFEDTRRRLLPQIVQEQYGAAKATFERKDFQAAVVQFRSLASLLEDPALKGEDPRGDFRMVVSAFADLSQAAVATEKAPAPAPTLASSPSLELAAAAPPERGEVGGAAVFPPVPLSKPLPQIPRHMATMWRDRVAVLDILVTEDGNVAEVAVQKGVHAQFDRQLVDAVRTWKFRPATRGGQPVTFRQIVEVKLVP